MLLQKWSLDVLFARPAPKMGHWMSIRLVTRSFSCMLQGIHVQMFCIEDM